MLFFFCLKRKSNVCQFISVKELPALGYLYNNVCNDVTCAGMPVLSLVGIDLYYLPLAIQY